MPTFAGLVEETLGILKSYSSDQERRTYLTSGIDADDTAIPLADADKASESMVEIDEELVEIASVDTLSGTATAFPWGRGQGGTTAATHATNARVTISPRWPRYTVKQRINQVIGGLWPDLFRITTDTSQTTSYTKVTYELPAAAREVLDIRWQTDGSPPEYWAGVHSWRMDASAYTALHPTGVTVDIGEPMSTGRTLKITYKTEPTQLAADADDFAAVSGLPSTASDLVCLGAAARLVASLDVARNQTFSVEHGERIAGMQLGSAVAASKYLMQLYQTRLLQERDRLYERYPMRLSRTWI